MWFSMPIVWCVFCATSGVLLSNLGGFVTTALRTFRFRLTDIAVTAIVVALASWLAPAAHDRHLEGGAIIVIEAAALVLAGYAAIRYARTSTDVKQWTASVIAAGCFAAVVGLGIFYWHVTENFAQLSTA